jgi:hypothetical protein
MCHRDRHPGPILGRHLARSTRRLLSHQPGRAPPPSRPARRCPPPMERTEPTTLGRLRNHRDPDKPMGLLRPTRQHLPPMGPAPSHPRPMRERDKAAEERRPRPYSPAPNSPVNRARSESGTFRGRQRSWVGVDQRRRTGSIAADPAYRTAPTAPAAFHPVVCPPDRCPFAKNDHVFANIIIPGLRDTYPHLTTRVTSLLADSGQTSRK